MESVNENVIDLIINKEEQVKKIMFSDEKFIGDIKRMYPGRDLELGFDACWLHFSQQPGFERMVYWEWRNKFSGWISRMEIKKVNGKDNKYKLQ
jgi:hypothetical protein